MSGETKWTVNNSMIAGAGGGLVASVATCPLDVVKTKLQAQRAKYGDIAYKGVFGTVRHIIMVDGLRGLYRGLGPTILGYLPTWAIYFAVYDGIKTKFGEAPLGAVAAPSNNSSAPGRKSNIYPAAQAKGYQPLAREHPWGLHIMSAMVAGSTSTVCTNPLWVIKTRFMTQPPNEGRYRHTWDAFVTIYRTEGIAAFYRGLFPSLLGIAHVAVQFPLYEKLKNWTQSDSTAPLTKSQILGCSGVAKMCASVATYPHEVVRTRLQTQRRLLTATLSPSPAMSHSPRASASPPSLGEKPILGTSSHSQPSPQQSTLQPQAPQQPHPHSATGADADGVPRSRQGVIYTTKRIVRLEGWRGLYKGLSVNLIRTVPNSAVTMLTYELLMRYLSAQEVA